MREQIWTTIRALIFGAAIVTAFGIFGEFYFAGAKYRAELDLLKQKDQQAWIEAMQEKQIHMFKGQQPRGA